MINAFKPLACTIALCLMLAAGLVGCSDSQQQSVAAKFGDNVITEDQVTAYTEDYRNEHSLTSDEVWAEYLVENELTASDWRERVIRFLADEVLIKDKASELGITVNQDDVDQKLSAAKDEYGIAQDDEEAWANKLAELGTTPQEYEENLEFSSLEQQVVTKELTLESGDDASLQKSYINSNLADRILHRYSFIGFAKDDKTQALKCLAELRKLSGEKLTNRFAELARELSTDSESAANGGDIGWDVACDMTKYDADTKVGLTKTKELCAKVLKTEDGWGLLLCTCRFVVEKDMTADDMPDEVLSNYIISMTTMANWSNQTSQYLTQLEDAAQIQVAQMPSGLSYDVDLSKASTDGGVTGS